MTRLVALLLLMASGCASAPPAPGRRGSHGAAAAACVRPTLGHDSPYRLFLAGAVEDPALRPFLDGVPPELRHVVRATGLEPLVAKMLRQESEHPGVIDVERLALRQELTAHLAALGSQLASVLFELDCTGDALEVILREYEETARARELRLTIASLIVGALGGVAAGVWEAADDESKGPAILAATGAGVTAVLGTAAFVHKGRPITYMHPRNLLAPIVAGEDHDHLYPTFVFRLLTTSGVASGATPRDALLARFREVLGDVSGDDARASALLYGTGGVYDEPLLRARESMLEQLESSIGALSRELELLERYLARL